MRIPELTAKMVEETEKIIVGKTRQIKLMLMAILAEGHILLDDLPGVGKTGTGRAGAVSLRGEARGRLRAYR